MDKEYQSKSSITILADQQIKSTTSYEYHSSVYYPDYGYDAERRFLTCENRYDPFHLRSMFLPPMTCISIELAPKCK